VSHIRTQPHEVEGHLKFAPGTRDTYEGLAPYWFLTHLVINEFDGYSRKLETTIDGEHWTVEMNYWQTGIAPLEEHQTRGDRLYGYGVKGSGPGEKKAAFQIEPRFDGMEHYEDGDELSIPWAPDSDGVDADVHAANVEPERLPQLLRDFVAVLADEAGCHWNSDYFADPHRSSNVYAYERYVRIETSVAKQLVRQEGPFWRIWHLLGEQTGMKASFDINNEDVLGHMTKLRLLPYAAQQLVDTHRFGKQLKHYHMRNPDAQEGATEHPKFGVLLNKSMNDDEALAWHELNAARREIEETIVNVLDWAGISAAPDADHFIADDHFEPVESDQRIGRYDDPTPELEAKQELLLVQTMNDLSDGASELLQKVATDDSTHYAEAADDLGFSTSSIYRWLSEFGELVRNDNGELSIVSETLKREIIAIAERAERVVRACADRMSRLANQERDGSDSAIQRWMNTYGVEIDDGRGDQEGRIRIDELLSELRSTDQPRISDVLEEGRSAWGSAGLDVTRFDDMRVEASLAMNGEARGRARNWIG
jgi:hypothetical protein